MAKSHKRRNLEKRAKALGWTMRGGYGQISWVLRDDSSSSLRFYFGNLNEAKTAMDWLEGLGLKTDPTSVEDVNAHFLHSIAENAIYALESAGAEAELKLLLSYLEKVLARIHNPI